MGISPALRPTANISDASSAVSQNLACIAAIAKVDFVLVEALPQRDSPVSITDSGKVMLIVEIDREAERARLGKEMSRVEAEMANSLGKLAKESFVKGAPPAVVEQERKRLAEREIRLGELRAQLAKLE